MKGLMRLLPVVLALMLASAIHAQRRVTPVTPETPGAPARDKERAERVDRSRLVERTDAAGNVIMVDSVTGKEFVDSTMLPAPPPMEYPLLHEAIAGVNLWDPFMRAFGQSFGLADVWGELSLHNRYFPFLAIGLGNCNDTPDGMNFTFKVPAAPYFKLGASYNFFYNSNPDYKLKMGLRYGFTSFKWSVTDVTVDEGYWDAPSHFSIMDQKTTAGYMEVTFGISVRVLRQWSLGWTIIYHSILHESASPHGSPMYIPGYGKRNGSFTGSFSLSYTIPINKKTLPAVSNIEESPRISTSTDPE